MELIPLLKRLTEAVGLSGYEASIRQEVESAWSPYLDEMRVDRLGNLIGLKKGTGAEPRRKLMLASHMDEIGLMVVQIDQGFLHVTEVGGLDQRLLLGQPVTVHGRRDLPGVIGSRPPHLLTAGERSKLVPWDKLLVDVGLSPEEVASTVRVGNLISFRQELRELMDGRVAAKALDNRASVVALAVCLEALQTRRHAWDVYVVATVQEEETLGGASTSTYSIQPDVGIAIDVTFGKGPGSGDEDTFPLGKGPTIGYGPNNHPGVHQGLVAAAKSIELPHHIEPIPGHSGTDAWIMQVSRAGVPTAGVSIPIRNMHMPVEVVDVKDIERTGRLLAEFAVSLDEDFVEKLAWDRKETEEDKA